MFVIDFHRDLLTSSRLIMLNFCHMAESSKWMQWLERGDKWGAAVRPTCVSAAGLLEFPSFRLFNLMAFICINHTTIRATSVLSTSVHSKNSGRCPRPTYGRI